MTVGSLDSSHYRRNSVFTIKQLLRNHRGIGHRTLGTTERRDTTDFFAICRYRSEEYKLHYSNAPPLDLIHKRNQQQWTVFLTLLHGVESFLRS